MNTHPIGIFDSGVGGLTVYQAFQSALPSENFLYLGDTARLPYGAKTPDTIMRYSLQAAAKLIEAGVKYLVIACNTATSSALEVLQQHYPDIPIVGVIEPGARAALSTSKEKRIAVIATAATVRARAYEKILSSIDAQVTVLTKPAPLLVALAEEGLITGEIPMQILHHYLDEWLNLPAAAMPETLILGCTHFPVLIPAIQQVVKGKMKIVDSACTVAKDAQRYFINNPHLANPGLHGTSQFWVTDGIERFLKVAHIFLKQNIDPDQIELVELC